MGRDETPPDYRRTALYRCDTRLRLARSDPVRAGRERGGLRPSGSRPDCRPAIRTAAAQHRRVPGRRHGRDGHLGAVPDRRGRPPRAVPAQRLLPDAEHGAPGRARDPLQQLHGDERVLADAHLDHDGSERRAAPDDELDRSGRRQPRCPGAAGVELAGPHEDRRHPAVAAARGRLPHHSRREGAFRPERVGGRRSAESRVRRQRWRARDRPTRELLRPGGVRQGRHARRAPPRALPRHRDVPHRCAHDRGRSTRGRRGGRAAAVLPQHGPLRSPRAVPERSPVRGALRGLRQARARPGLRDTDRRHGRVAGPAARSPRHDSGWPGTR